MTLNWVPVAPASRPLASWKHAIEYPIRLSRKSEAIALAAGMSRLICNLKFDTSC